MDEFQIIATYFLRSNCRRSVKKGIGDDAAVLAARSGEDLVVTTDTMIEGVHFYKHTDPSAIGHKVLAVSLSDLAAMGAEPDWATLNLSMPTVDASWLEQFSKGFFALADRYHVVLVGGDTCRGPLNVSVTLGGWTPKGKAISRAGAECGDLIYVSGNLGDSALGLKLLSEDENQSTDQNRRLIERLHRPDPRIELGKELRDLASAAIDISDGLASDLRHIGIASGGLGSLIEVERIPFSCDALNVSRRDLLTPMALSGGDDYELCFCISPEREGKLERINDRLSLNLTMVGKMVETAGIWLVDDKDTSEEYLSEGYRHSWLED